MQLQPDSSETSNLLPLLARVERAFATSISAHQPFQLYMVDRSRLSSSHAKGLSRPARDSCVKALVDTGHRDASLVLRCSSPNDAKLRHRSRSAERLILAIDHASWWPAMRMRACMRWRSAATPAWDTTIDLRSTLDEAWRSSTVHCFKCSTLHFLSGVLMEWRKLALEIHWQACSL